MNIKNISCFKEKSINKNDSLAIKGFVIILIILGHNKLLSCEHLPFLFGYLYSFHVGVFFILPLFYDIKKTHKIREHIPNTFVKLFIPYIILYTLLFVLNRFMNISWSISDVYMYFVGMFSVDPSVIYKTSNAQYMWFVPSFFFFSVVLDYLKRNKYDTIKFLLPIALVLYSLGDFIYNLLFRLPLYLTISFGSLIIVENIKKTVYIKILSVTSFAILSVVIINGYLQPKGWVHLVMSISFFLIIYSYREIFGKMPMLKEIGKYSFPMYLLHFFIYNTLVLILPHTFLSSLMILILTIFLSYIISWVIMKNVRPYIFPNSFTELKNTWLKNSSLCKKTK